MRFVKRFFSQSIKKLSSLDAYELWAESYHDSPHNAFMEAEQQGLLNLLPHLQNKVVLDLASGTGRYSQVIQSQQPRLTIACDNSYPMLQHNHHINRTLATMSQLPLQADSIDVIICALAIGHIPYLEHFFTESACVLKHNGLLLISDLHPDLAKQGAERTFSHNNKIYAVEHHIHTLSHQKKLASQVGFEILVSHSISVLDQKDPALLITKWRKN